MKKKDKDHYCLKLEQIMNCSWSEFGELGYSGATFSRAQAFALYALLNGATNCKAHIQYHSGRKDQIEGLMVWDNNIVFECEDENSAILLFNQLGKISKNFGTGYCNGKIFGRSTTKGNKETFRDIMVAFHSFKDDVERILKTD